MGRHSKGERIPVLVKISPAELALFDASRGDIPRMEWILQACRNQVSRDTKALLRKVKAVLAE